MNGITIHQGDCREVLQTLPDASVHCCVTSPPYWNLRDYGVDGQIGMEATPAEFVEQMVFVFREVRRVLRDDGTLWLNLGDSYARQGGEGKHGPNAVVGNTKSGEQRRNLVPPAGLKSKDLCGVPWRVALALQADGWYLRQDIIWHKPAPMPESVTDRCTKSHEYIFLFAKGQWKSRVVQCANIEGELFHLGQCVSGQVSATRTPLTRFCVRLASAIFDVAQLENDFCLPPFYAKEWEQLSDGGAACGTRLHAPGLDPGVRPRRGNASDYVRLEVDCEHDLRASAKGGSMTTNDGGPAFPHAHDHGAANLEAAWGMSLRDYFAGQALIGVLGARNGFLVDVGTDNAAEWAYRIADAMLAERAK